MQPYNSFCYCKVIKGSTQRHTSKDAVSIAFAEWTMGRGPSSHHKNVQVNKYGINTRYKEDKKLLKCRGKGKKLTKQSPNNARPLSSREAPVQNTDEIHGDDCDAGETFHPCVEAFSDDDEGEEEDIYEEHAEEPDVAQKEKGVVHYRGHVSPL